VEAVGAAADQAEGGVEGFDAGVREPVGERRESIISPVTIEKRAAWTPGRPRRPAYT
jgi:hypothetical protein